MDLAISFNSVVFPALGGETIIPLWPFPMGETISTIRIATFFPLTLHAKALIWENRSHIFKVCPPAGDSGGHAVHRFQIKQGAELLLLRLDSGISGDQIAGTQGKRLI